MWSNVSKQQVWGRGTVTSNPIGSLSLTGMVSALYENHASVYEQSSCGTSTSSHMIWLQSTEAAKPSKVRRTTSTLAFQRVRFFTYLLPA